MYRTEEFFVNNIALPILQLWRHCFTRPTNNVSDSQRENRYNKITRYCITITSKNSQTLTVVSMYAKNVSTRCIPVIIQSILTVGRWIYDRFILLNWSCCCRYRTRAMDNLVSIEFLSQIQEGQLYKYTNVVKGWQHRWFILDPREGTLSYFLVNNKNK